MRASSGSVVVLLAAGAFGLGTVPACLGPTEITLEVTTDAKCADVKGTLITIGALSTLDTKPATTLASACDPATGRIGAIVIVPSGERDDVVAMKLVTGIGKDPSECVPPAYGPGCIVARRALHFIPHASLRVPVLMATVCKGIPCEATQTCVGGDCASATIEDSSRCQEPGGCGETSLGPRVPADAGADAASDAAIEGGEGGVVEQVVPVDAVAACGRPSTYVDEFADGAIGPEWTRTVGAGGTIAKTGGHLVLSSAAGGNARLESRFAVDLTGDRLRVDVPVAPTPGTTARIGLRSPAAGELSMFARDGNLTFRTVAGASDDVVLPYNPVQHRWWQIVEVAGQVRWETSPDAKTWTTRKSTATPAFVRAVRMELESISGAAAGSAHFDRLNAGRPRAPWCKAQTLVDDFADNAVGREWTSTVQGACSTAEANGEVRFTMTGASASSYCAYTSTAAYDLRESVVYIQVPAITTFHPPVKFFLRVRDAAGNTAAVAFLGSNQLSHESVVASSALAVAAAYSTAETWWRLRGTGGSLYWETSSDGTTWVGKRQAAAPFALDAVQILLGVETAATMPSAISIGTPRIDIGPP